MTRLLLAALSELTFFACAVLCAESCAWINSATAAGILGGPVEAVVSHPAKNKDDSTCEFSRRNGFHNSVMHIEVISDKGPGTFHRFLGQCGSRPMPLADFGNEALACAGSGHHGKVSEQLIGRVRDRTFLVEVASSGKSSTRSLLREEAHSAAAQVMGKLF